MKSIKNSEFKNTFTDHFKGDLSGEPSSRITPAVLFSKVLPTPVTQPKLLGWSKDFAARLGIKNPGPEDIAILAGNEINPSMKPYALCYGGHQFGNWAGQLGDGRAITLGELNIKGATWELQLKGAGKTPYSRGADGRAVLRSSVREFLISEAMHHLEIPTTRALSLVSTGEKVMRDMFYDGNPEYEPGAIVARMAPTFLRFGNFEILAARGEKDNLRQLVNWVIEQYYPHITGPDKIADFFKEVVERTATLMVAWQRVGFVHGVMNTDNMSVLGLTLDYGPFSFLDKYDPEFTPNTTDLPGRRYAFGNQPSVAYWNLNRLAGALLPLFENPDKLEAGLLHYEGFFWRKYYEMMGKKLGFDKVTSEGTALISSFEKMLSTIKPDFTLFFRLLIDVPYTVSSEEEILLHFRECFYKDPEENEKKMFYNLISDYVQRLKKNSISREKSQQTMKKNNPCFVLRNYLLHQASEDLEVGNDLLFKKLQKASKIPYSEDFPEFFKKRPAWAETKAGCSMLSCSS